MGGEVASGLVAVLAAVVIGTHRVWHYGVFNGRIEFVP